jgi:hypothetical protein
MKKLSSWKMREIHKDELEALRKMRSDWQKDDREKYLKGCSGKHLTELVSCFNNYNRQSDAEKRLINDILYQRRWTLNQDFELTDKPVERLILISKKMREAWHESLMKVKKMLATLKIDEKNDKKFWRDFEIMLFVEPEIWGKDAEPVDDPLYNFLCTYMHENPTCWNDFQISLYKDIEKVYDEDSHITCEHKWETWTFGSIFKNIDLDLCFTLHTIAGRFPLACEDLLKVNHIGSGFNLEYEYRDRKNF